MNDSIRVSDPVWHATAVILGPESTEETPLDVVALRVARQRAGEARAAAERALREAQATEADLVAQEELAIAAAAEAKRERFAENARVAAASEREAFETLSALQLQIQRVGSMKAQTEAAVAAIRASLTEHEAQLRAAEASEWDLQGDVAIAERTAQDCTRARKHADAALHATEQHVPNGNGIRPALAASKPDPPSTLSVAAQRAAERRASDAARAASGQKDPATLGICKGAPCVAAGNGPIERYAGPGQFCPDCGEVLQPYVPGKSAWSLPESPSPPPGGEPTVSGPAAATA